MGIENNIDSNKSNNIEAKAPINTKSLEKAKKLSTKWKDSEGAENILDKIKASEDSKNPDCKIIMEWIKVCKKKQPKSIWATIKDLFK